MGPTKRVPPLSIAIPASLVAGTPHLREKTLRIGLIGRACAIFRVDEVVIYRDLPDSDQSGDEELISSILSYMETPQYLRKRLFSLKPSFKYVGILQPLRTPHHPTARHVRDLTPGEFREGIVVRSSGKRSHVDVGVERPAVLREPNLPVGQRVSVKIVGFHRKTPEVCLAKREEIDIYWGYRVSVSSFTLGQTVKEEAYDLVVATSRYGSPLTEKVEEIKKRWRSARRVLVAFGSPNKGLNEILKRENLKLAEVADFTVNTLPSQGTETVRTEEAIYASLAALNLMV